MPKGVSLEPAPAGIVSRRDRAILDRLHNGMRASRLVYGDRPIGVALRPHWNRPP